MKEQILEILKEIKENQEEIKVDIKKLNDRMDDVERNINCIELVTSKNWMDVTRLKQERKALNAFKELKEIRGEENITYTLKFLQHKIREIEEDVSLLKNKITQ